MVWCSKRAPCVIMLLQFGIFPDQAVVEFDIPYDYPTFVCFCKLGSS